MPTPWAVICATLGMLIAKALARDVLKVSFNVAKTTLATTAAGAAAYLAGIRPPADLSIADRSGPQILAGLALAALAYAVVEELLAHTVVAMATRTSWLQSFTRNWDVVAVVRLANVVIATLIVIIVEVEALLIVAMVPTVFALQFATKNRIRQRTDEEALAASGRQH